MLKNIKIKIKTINLKKIGSRLIELHIKWFVTYKICRYSFGTAYCAPAFFRLFTEEKQPTMLEAMQNANLTWGNFLVIVVASYAVFKAVDYLGDFAWNVCKGIYEGFTGKIVLSSEQKFDNMHQICTELKRENALLMQGLGQIKGELDAGKLREIECFNGAYQDLADIKNGGEAVMSQLQRLEHELQNIQAISSGASYQPQFEDIAHRLEELRAAYATLNTTASANLDRVVIQLQNVAQSLDYAPTEELTTIAGTLRDNIGYIQRIIEQNNIALQNPILHEEITIPSNEQTAIIERSSSSTVINQPQTEPVRSLHEARRVGVSAPIPTQNSSDISTGILSNSNAVGNQVVVNGLQPGEYSLVITSQGNIHIDPITSALSTVARAASNPNSMSGNLVNGLLGVATNPDVQNAVISYGARMLSRPSMPMPNMPYAGMPQMPMYYPPMPMIPYGYFPQQIPGGAQNTTDAIATAGGQFGEAVGKIVGSVGGKLLKGIWGSF